MKKLIGYKDYDVNYPNVSYAPKLKLTEFQHYKQENASFNMLRKLFFKKYFYNVNKKLVEDKDNDKN